MFSFIGENFLHVVPILFTGMIAIAITVERLRALFWTYPLLQKRQFLDKVRELVVSERVAEAVSLCERYAEKPYAQVVKEGLLRAHQPEEMITDGLQLAVSECSQLLVKRTGFLATIANVATLLGLFGTIAGLIQSFEAVGHADAQQKAAILANGISTAMNATMLGLGVAIPCMIAYSFLMNRTNRLNAELDQAAMRTLDILRHQRYYSNERAYNNGASAHKSA